MAEGQFPSVAILGTRGLPPRYGGFEVLADQLASRLSATGFPVTVYCPDRAGPRHAVYSGAKLTYVWHPPGPLGTLVYDGLCLAHSCAAGYDVLLMLGYASAPFLLLPVLLKRKVLLNPDGVEWRRSKWTLGSRMYLKACETLGARLASGLVADSTSIQAYFRKRRGVSSVFIPYGAEIPEDSSPPDWNALGLAPSQYYLSVTRLEPENSVREIVEGFLSSGSTKRLALVTGPITPHFRSRIQPLIQDRPSIAFLGPLYDRALAFALRQNAFAYLHGNTVGGTSPALLEAMSAGRPVVARENEFTREVLAGAGLYFRNASDLAPLLRHLESLDEDARGRLASAALERLRPTYTWENVADLYARAIREL